MGLAALPLESPFHRLTLSLSTGLKRGLHKNGQVLLFLNNLHVKPSVCKRSMTAFVNRRSCTHSMESESQDKLFPAHASPSIRINILYGKKTKTHYIRYPGHPSAPCYATPFPRAWSTSHFSQWKDSLLSPRVGSGPQWGCSDVANSNLGPLFTFNSRLLCA